MTFLFKIKKIKSFVFTKLPKNKLIAILYIKELLSVYVHYSLYNIMWYFTLEYMWIFNISDIIVPG